MKLHCVKCDEIWGEGEFHGSSGICPRCFKDWLTIKKNVKCYGEFGLQDIEICKRCIISSMCKKDTNAI